MTRLFPEANMRHYLDDLPDAEFHALDTGHFALEDKGDEIATLMREFLKRSAAVRGIVTKPRQRRLGRCVLVCVGAVALT